MQRTFRQALIEVFSFQSKHPELFSGSEVEIDEVFAKTIETDKSVVVNVYEEDSIPPPHAALVKDRHNEYHIIFSQSQNWCLKRLGICKELCHVLTDDAEVRAKDPADQLTFAVKRPKLTDPDKVLTSEEFCYFMAVELLIPPHRRKELFELHQSGCDFYDIALSVRVPQFAIEDMFNSPHWALSDYVRADYLADSAGSQ